MWKTPDGMPDVRIVKNAAANETEVRDLANTICLAEGLIDRALDAQESAKRNLGSKIPRLFGPLSVAKACIMWSYAHEAFHYLRRHEMVARHFGNDVETRHALEYDADLCAVAAIYRYLKFFSSLKYSLALKKATLQLLYFPLRLDIGEGGHGWEGTQTHPHTAARIMDIIGKLAMIQDSGLPDPNFEDPVAIAHHAKLFNVLIKLDAKYKNIKDGELIAQANEVVKFAAENSTLKYTEARHARWDEIQPLIFHFMMMPREKVDNESSIAFFGDHFSLPREKK